VCSSDLRDRQAVLGMRVGSASALWAQRTDHSSFNIISAAVLLHWRVNVEPIRR